MEMIDIIDNNGRLTGKVCGRKDVHKYGLLHHASGVIMLSKVSGGGIEYSLNNVLIKKRKMQGFGIWMQVGMCLQGNRLCHL